MCHLFPIRMLTDAVTELNSVQNSYVMISKPKKPQFIWTPFNQEWSYNIIQASEMQSSIAKGRFLEMFFKKGTIPDGLSLCFFSSFLFFSWTVDTAPTFWASNENNQLRMEQRAKKESVSIKALNGHDTSRDLLISRLQLHKESKATFEWVTVIGLLSASSRYNCNW